MRFSLGSPQESSIKSEVPARPETLVLSNITLGLDVVLLFGFLGWLVYKRVVYPLLLKRIDKLLRPDTEDVLLVVSLAQIGKLAKADRVVLTKLHNGILGPNGYHLLRLSTVHSYVAPGAQPMVKKITNLPVEKIAYELKQLNESPDFWVTIENRHDLPVPCKDHLNKNFIELMHNHLIKVGDLPIGILSLQYLRTKPSDVSELQIDAVHELVVIIARIMRERILDPGPVYKAWKQLLGFIGA